MNEAIRLAIEKGGYRGGDKFTPDNREHLVRACESDRTILLDPAFWQALGKALSKEQVEVEMCGKKVLMDRITLGLLGDYAWELTEKGYLRGWSTKDNTRIFLHRLVKQCGQNEFIDHINGNKLDNRADNLRIVTLQENALNKRKTKLGEYRGVYWHKKREKWIGQVRYKKRSYYAGYFDDKDEAAQATEALRNKLYNEFHNGTTKEWWLETWHRFIDHIADGKSPDEFFSNLN